MGVDKEAAKIATLFIGVVLAIAASVISAVFAVVWLAIHVHVAFLLLPLIALPAHLWWGIYRKERHDF